MDWWYYNGSIFEFEENHLGYCVCNTNQVIGENEKFIDLPPTINQKVSAKKTKTHRVNKLFSKKF